MKTRFRIVLILFGMHILMSSSSVAQNDRLNCSLLGRWAHGPGYAMIAVGDTFYFADGGYLRIMDFSDNQNPVEFKRIDVSAQVVKMAVKRNHLYTIDTKFQLQRHP